MASMSLLVLSSAACLAEPPNPSEKAMIQLTTVYLETPIGRAHRLGFTGELGGAGIVSIDPNTGSLNAFGDVKTGTELVIVPARVSFLPVHRGETSGKDGDRLYDVVGKQLPRMRLLIRSGNRPARLLVLDDAGKTLRVVTLEPAP